MYVCMYMYVCNVWELCALEQHRVRTQKRKKVVTQFFKSCKEVLSTPKILRVYKLVR